MQVETIKLAKLSFAMMLERSCKECLMKRP